MNDVIAMIPARIGSQRLKMKNLALIDGKPMIHYAIDAAKKSKVFSSIVVNSDHEVFGEIASKEEVDFYFRPQDIGSSFATADEVVFDFIEKFPDVENVAWINPTSPLQTGEEIKKITQYFFEKQLDSLITVEEKNVHSRYKKNPINYDLDSGFAQTQSLTKIEVFAYSVMIWKTSTFKESFKKNGYAMFAGKFDVFPISKLSGLIVKNEEDLMICDLIMRGLNSGEKKYTLNYYNSSKL